MSSAGFDLPRESTPFSSVLILHQGALGDLVLLFPILKILKQNQYRIGLAARGETGRLARDFGLADDSFSSDSQIFAPLFFGPPNNALNRLLSKYDRLVMFSKKPEHPVDLSNFPLIISRLPLMVMAPEGMHCTDFMVRQFTDRDFFNRPDRMDLDGRGPIITSLFKPSIDLTTKRVLIHPGSGSLRKNWPVNRFIETGKLLCRDGFQPVFLTGPGDGDVLRRLMKNGFSRDRVMSTTSLSDLVSQITSAYGFIGNDSGPTHLAAAMGVLTLAIFGPSDAVRWHPLGPFVSTFRLNLECSPCFETIKENCSENRCLAGILPEKLYQAFKSLAVSFKPQLRGANIEG